MKLTNSLKFQFIGLFTLFIIASIGISAIIGVRKMESVAVDTFSSMGIRTVERAVSLIDGDSFEALARSLDKDDPYYEKTRLQLFELKEYSGSQYLYTMAPLRGSVWHYIIDGSAPPDDPEDFSDMGDEEDTDEYDDAFRKSLASLKTEIGRLAYQEDWGWLINIYSPILNSAGNMVGMVGCDFNGDELRKAIVTETMAQSIIGGVAILIGLVLMVFFLQRIFGPIGKVNAILKEISHGEGDLTKRIAYGSDNEIGSLANYFNITLDKIKNLVVNIKQEAAHSFDASNDMASNMQETAGAIKQITDVIQSIKQKVTRQSASVVETKSTMERVTHNIDKLKQNVEDQTESVARSSTAIEQMLSNIQSVTNTLVHNEESVKELIKVSDAGRTSLQKVSQDIQEIAKESEGLLEINAVMENIASQTNLLSMNAAIEAAHAGEAGKGFAVVAGEIRKLAVNSSEQSRTISDVLKRIQTANNTITASTNTVMEKFHAIEEKVRTVSQEEANIRNAMEEQGQGSQQILEAVARMNELTHMVKQGTEEMFERSKEVIQESKNLEQATTEIAGGMNDMASEAEEINSAVGNVNEISKANKEHISNLFAEVSKFKVDG